MKFLPIFLWSHAFWESRNVFPVQTKHFLAIAVFNIPTLWRDVEENVTFTLYFPWNCFYLRQISHASERVHHKRLLGPILPTIQIQILTTITVNRILARKHCESGINFGCWANPDWLMGRAGRPDGDILQGKTLRHCTSGSQHPRPQPAIIVGIVCMRVHGCSAAHNHQEVYSKLE